MTPICPEPEKRNPTVRTRGREQTRRARAAGVVRRWSESCFAAGMLVLLAACGGSSSRPGTHSAAENRGKTGSAGTEIPAPRKNTPEAVPKGRIIPLTDSMLVHGGTDTIRFGHLRPGEIAVQRFHLENACSTPVVLVSTQRSCGCISLEHEAQPVAPGEFRSMEMTFDSRGEYGWQLKRMDLLFSGSRRPLRIFVEADVE